MDNHTDAVTLKELNAYRKCRACRDIVVPFIKECDDPYIRTLMVLRYGKRLTWEGVSSRIGYGSADSCRVAVKRYIERKLEVQNDRARSYKSSN